MAPPAGNPRTVLTEFNRCRFCTLSAVGLMSVVAGIVAAESVANWLAILFVGTPPTLAAYLFERARLIVDSENLTIINPMARAKRIPWSAIVEISSHDYGWRGWRPTVRTRAGLVVPLGTVFVTGPNEPPRWGQSEEALAVVEEYWRAVVD